MPSPYAGIACRSWCLRSLDGRLPDDQKAIQHGGVAVIPCLFSVSYAGLWGQAALSLPDFLRRAHQLGYPAVMLMAKRPHLSPLDASDERLACWKEVLAETGVRCAVLGAYTDFSGAGAAEVPYLEMQIAYVESTARLAQALGAQIVRVFTAYENAAAPLAVVWNRTVAALRDEREQQAA